MLPMSFHSAIISFSNVLIVIEDGSSCCLDIWYTCISYLGLRYRSRFQDFILFQLTRFMTEQQPYWAILSYGHISFSLNIEGWIFIQKYIMHRYRSILSFNQVD